MYEDCVYSQLYIRTLNKEASQITLSYSCINVDTTVTTHRTRTITTNTLVNEIMSKTFLTVQTGCVSSVLRLHKVIS